MHKLRQALTHARPRHSTIAAYTALVLSITGSAYAAVNLPAGSVGPRQIRNGAVTPAKLNANQIGAYIRAWAVVDGAGHVLASHPRAHTDHFGGGDGNVRWRRVSEAGCFALATSASFGDVPVTAIAGPGRVFISAGDRAGTVPETVDVALLCAP